MANVNLITKVLDFVKPGGPELTVRGTTFETCIPLCSADYRQYEEPFYQGQGVTSYSASATLRSPTYTYTT